jgi:hypothetical protein
MPRTALPSFDLYRHEVEGMIEAGEAFPSVADAIGKTEFSHDDKAALWLIAWVTADMQHRGRDRLTMLRLLSSPCPTPARSPLSERRQSLQCEAQIATRRTSGGGSRRDEGQPRKGAAEPALMKY